MLESFVALRWQPHHQSRCVALLERPGEVPITDSLQENFLADVINTTKARRKGKGLGISERLDLVTGKVRSLAYKETKLEFELKRIKRVVSIISGKEYRTVDFKDFILFYIVISKK
jgi:hypothetical protein